MPPADIHSFPHSLTVSFPCLVLPKEINCVLRLEATCTVNTYKHGMMFPNVFKLEKGVLISAVKISSKNNSKIQNAHTPQCTRPAQKLPSPVTRMLNIGRDRKMNLLFPPQTEEVPLHPSPDKGGFWTLAFETHSQKQK